MKRALVIAVGISLTAVACGGSAKQADSPPSRTAAEPETAPAPSVRPAGVVIPVGDTPEGLVVDDASGLAIAALRRPDSLALVSLTGTHRIRLVATPGRARHLRLLAPGGPLLFPAEDTDQLIELALPAATVISKVATRRQPHDAVEAGGRIWITDELAGTVTSVGAGGRTLNAGLQPGGLAAAAGRVAVADVRGNRLYVFDAKSQRQVAVLPAGAGPTHVVQVDATTVAVADTRGDAVLLYALDGEPRMVARLPLAGGPYGLAADPLRHHLWVALSGRNQLVRLDIRGDAVKGDKVKGDELVRSSVTLPTVQQPNSVAISATTGEVVVAGATAAGFLQLIVDPH
jgi:hypothetical protein